MEPSGSASRSETKESPEDKKKLNEDLVVFMRKRSDTDAPRYTARLKTYVDFQEKKRRADDARHHRRHDALKTSPPGKDKETAPSRRKSEPHHSRRLRDRDALSERSEDSRTRGQGGAPDEQRRRSVSPRTDPTDRCGRRRRRRQRSRCRRRRSCRRRRRRRRRGCRRRRRRRRSCPGRRRRRRRLSCPGRRRRHHRRRC